MMRTLTCLAFALVSGLLPAQQVSIDRWGGAQFVDFHRDLDRGGVVVAIGRLGKCKEGRREKLENGQLGGGGVVSSISGTQFFKVPLTTTLQIKKALAGEVKDGDKPSLAFDAQVARLDDGSEQRQVLTGNGARIDADALGLFVLAPQRDKKARKKGLDVLHAIVFTPQPSDGPDAELEFADTLRDFFVVNRRMADFEQALAALEEAGDKPDARKAALDRLQALCDQQVELRKPKNDGLLTQHVGPLEARAKQKLAAAKPAAGGDAPPEGRPTGG